MHTVHELIGLLRQLTNPDTLNGWAHSLGPWLYVILFAILFAETGLVVTPFLPGDSLLFALGAMTALANATMSLPLIAVLLIAAAVLGDAVNYAIGFYVGPKVFKSESSWLLNKKHLVEAQRFYDKYGDKTIVLARFVPIVRTFAPFVAGIGRMNYFRFALYNVVGGAGWVLICLLAGRMFGNLDVVKKNFELVLVAIIAISLLPPAIEFIRHRRKGEPADEALVEATTTIGEDAPTA